MQQVLEVYKKSFLEQHIGLNFTVQMISLIIILLVAMFSLRLVGKKSISQLTLPNVVFVFIFTTCMGTLVTMPQALLIALILTAVIITIIITIEILQLKYDWLERLLVGRPNVLVYNGEPDTEQLKKAKITIDMLESQIRLQGLHGLYECKTITLEPNGNIGVEIKPEYEPIQKIYFDEAIKQILKAIDKNNEYIEAVYPDLTNVFEEAKGKLDKKDKNT
jgi:uncharacterized membrane protein YcaP (DUF421 family)